MVIISCPKCHALCVSREHIKDEQGKSTNEVICEGCEVV